MSEWTHGWLFVHDGTYYWVGAPDVETAKRMVAVHSPDAAKTEPERLANGAGHICLPNGQVMVGKVGA